MASMNNEDFDKGDFLMATKILTTKIRLEPANHELYFERAICHHKLGNFRASLDDANEAIKLNPSDYTFHHQKGLALVGLSMFAEAVTSFKKAIELRARQEDSKLSDIFCIIKDASQEINSARGRPRAAGQQQTRASDTASTSATSSSNNLQATNRMSTSGEPVDSTTDRPMSKIGSPEPRGTTFKLDNVIKNNNNNDLVAANCNNQPLHGSSPNIERVLNMGSNINKVSSSANHCNNNNNQMSSSRSATQPTDISNIDATDYQNQLTDQAKASQFEWNIRRSERIFLHQTNEPSGLSPQLASTDPNTRLAIGVQSKPKTSSNPSSIGSGKGPNKRIHESGLAYQTSARAPNSFKAGTTNSHLDSDIEIDGTKLDQRSGIIANQILTNGNQRKRVMVVPSSSMPATSQVPAPNVSTTKNDSYSSKYKRLRRDRERARRGTSKLCTIKPADLEELQRPSLAGSEKKSMRVIAPIDGWLYSGQLSVDDGEDAGGQAHFVVKLDGDSSGSSYLFTQETVLNDVIKEVRVKSVSDLRKGARICCYWSRTYKCLSTGVVTSRTFEATKSLVSVKYDNGDLSALPLEDLRLLPPDYPKYMSNCDPLLLARNGDGVVVPSECTIQNGVNRLALAKESTNGAATNAPITPLVNSPQNETIPPLAPEPNNNDTNLSESKLQIDTSNQVSFQPIDQDDTEDEEVIPPTIEAIDFITNGGVNDDSDDCGGGGADESSDKRIVGTKDSMVLANESQLAITGASLASSEENNFGVEYRPWVFEGEAKRTKRHGRTYRDTYTAIRRGNEVLKIGDSAELMPRDVSILPFIAKIDGLWSTNRGEMRVRVRWYYRLVETEGEPYPLNDGENALFETDHFDENDVQSIWRSTKILSWTDYCKANLGHKNKQNEGPKIFYLAGYYDPVKKVKHLRSDVKGDCTMYYMCER